MCVCVCVCVCVLSLGYELYNIIVIFSKVLNMIFIKRKKVLYVTIFSQAGFFLVQYSHLWQRHLDKLVNLFSMGKLKVMCADLSLPVILVKSPLFLSLFSFFLFLCSCVEHTKHSLTRT